MSDIVEGYCPMGCGETLFRSLAGKIRCSNVECPAPYSVHEILSDPETEHLVMLLEGSFNVKHPLRERLNDQVLNCQLGEWLVDGGGPNFDGVKGLYRVYWDGKGAGNWVRL